jgi:hypothetical protein
MQHFPTHPVAGAMETARETQVLRIRFEVRLADEMLRLPRLVSEHDDRLVGIHHMAPTSSNRTTSQPARACGHHHQPGNKGNRLPCHVWFHETELASMTLPDKPTPKAELRAYFPGSIDEG